MAQRTPNRPFPPAPKAARSWQAATFACAGALVFVVFSGAGQPAAQQKAPTGPVLVGLAADGDKLYRMFSDGTVQFTKTRQGSQRTARGYANWRLLPIDPDL